jgi:uncharacterized protein (TIGR01319 family)
MMVMKYDYLVAEIGSTTTVINCFSKDENGILSFCGQGFSPTTVLEGDVTVGLKGAIDSLKSNLGIKEIEYDKLLATSSAAGGLKMTVHGLVYDMTVKAAKEAALGAGANIHYVTSGKLRRTDLAKIKEISPNIILLAGGVNYGEKDTALYNAEKICQLQIHVPVIYAGNIENSEEIKLIFEEYNLFNYLYIVDNVYPRIDTLDVEPTRKVIQEVFEEHIIHAPGMDKIKSMVKGSIIPTPGAVMESTKLLNDILGDVMTIDVGGATTDIHSVTDGSEEVSELLISPEPKAKRTVEGDLGVYVNRKNIVSLIGIEKLEKLIGLDNIEALVDGISPIPSTELERRIVKILTEEAVITSTLRHAGGYRSIYGSSGRKNIAEGKDLTAVKYIIGTGGALTRLESSIEILSKISVLGNTDKLLPNKSVEILIDKLYIMASLGVLAKENREEALMLLMNSIGISKDG